MIRAVIVVKYLPSSFHIQKMLVELEANYHIFAVFASIHQQPNISTDTLQSITSGDWDVTQVLAYNEENQLM